MRPAAINRDDGVEVVILRLIFLPSGPHVSEFPTCGLFYKYFYIYTAIYTAIIRFTHFSIRGFKFKLVSVAHELITSSSFWLGV